MCVNALWWAWIMLDTYMLIPKFSIIHHNSEGCDALKIDHSLLCTTSLVDHMFAWCEDESYVCMILWSLCVRPDGLCVCLHTHWHWYSLLLSKIENCENLKIVNFCLPSHGPALPSTSSATLVTIMVHYTLRTPLVLVLVSLASCAEAAFTSSSRWSRHFIISGRSQCDLVSHSSPFNVVKTVLIRTNLHQCYQHTCHLLGDV